MARWSHAARFAVALCFVGFCFSILNRSSRAQNQPDRGRDDRDRHHRFRPAGLRKIKHIVFLVKENRTFDNYFGTFPGADGASYGAVSTGEVIPLRHAPDTLPRDISHSFQSAVLAIDGGAMDKFDLIAGANQGGDYLAYTQYTEEDLPNYFAYAKNFVLAAEFFSSLTGPSFPNHLYTVGAQSGGAIDNPTSPNRWGCDSAPTSRVQVMDDDGKAMPEYPCFDFQTLADLLQRDGFSWKYYAPGQDQPGYIWSTLEFSSVLKLIEDRFDLDRLTQRDEHSNDLFDAFDFDAHHPRPPLILNQRQRPSASSQADFQLDPQYHGAVPGQ